MTKGAGAKSYMTENSPGFSLNMTKISNLGENSYLRGKFPSIFPIYDENLRTGRKVPLVFP
jgi:hypothetical protein